MKFMLVGGWMAALLVAGCAGPVVRSEVLQPGSGPVSTLSFKAERFEFEGTGSGNTSLNATWNPVMSHFGNVLVRTLSESFPKRLAEQGVELVEAGPETSRLVIQPQTYRVMCGGGAGCNATLVVGGVLIGPGDVRRWTFESPLAYEGFNQQTFDAFELEIIERLVKDGIIPGKKAR